MTEAPDSFEELSRRGHDVFTAAVRAWDEAARSIVEAARHPQGRLPDVRATLDAAFDLAARMLAEQREFAKNLLAAGTKVTAAAAEPVSPGAEAESATGSDLRPAPDTLPATTGSGVHATTSQGPDAPPPESPAPTPPSERAAPPPPPESAAPPPPPESAAPPPPPESAAPPPPPERAAPTPTAGGPAPTPTPAKRTGAKKAAASNAAVVAEREPAKATATRAAAPAKKRTARKSTPAKRTPAPRSGDGT
jgi:hypothetical protein